jgi:cell wall-associated NlpC family hydrolase
MLLVARPAAGQVQVIIGGPDPTPPPRAAQANKADTNARTAPSAYLVSSLGAQVAEYAQKLVGAPYLWGGAGPGGFDCSGYTQYVFRQFGIAIPRTADVQFAYGQTIDGDPLPGDLVFFQTYDYGASHVGVYLGNGYFVSSIGANVHVSSFASAYFTSRYLGARRFVRSY